MNYTRIAIGDALTVLKRLPSELLHSCVTSPPYWLQRDYEVVGQIGLEQTPQEYVEKLCQVFDEVWRTLRTDGTCWVVLGDTYFKDGKSGTPKSLALIPSRFEVAMTDRGWILRNKIIWHKSNVTPSSVKDRFTVDYEELFFFVKSKRYYFEQQFIPYRASTWNRIRQFARNGERFDPARHKAYHDQGSMVVLERFAHKNLSIPGQSPHGMHKRRANGDGEPALRVEGANMRTVWTIPVARCADAHFAVYPEKLIETPIVAGCPEAGTVLDPFSGAGTTGIVCERLGRSFLGIELNPAYVEIAKKRIREARNRNDEFGESETREPEHSSSLTMSTARSSKKRNISKQTLSFSCSKSMQYLRTPPDIWQALSQEFGFSVDVCASHDNHLLPRYYTEAEDGLQQDWAGEVVYCHPMFDGKIGRWVEKAFNSPCLIVLLLPASTHTKYFHEFINGNPRCEVRFLRKPVKGFRFGHDGGQPDDESRIGYIKPLMIVIFSNEDTLHSADCKRMGEDY